MNAWVGRSYRRSPAIAVLLLAAAPLCAATPPDAAHIVQEGNGHGAPACSTCHGMDGGSQGASAFPRLAGLDAAYLQHQLDSFADGTRDNPVMTPIAKALSEDEHHALADYYSQQAIPSSVEKATTAVVDATLGERLAMRGRWSQQVPACVQCHGPHGVGVGANFPPLAGQPASYLANQLRAWKQGKRKNDPLQLMQHVSSSLDNADIMAVSAWFAAQSAIPTGGKR